MKKSKKTKPMTQAQILRQAREEKMLKDGYVSVQKAAALTMRPINTIYQWIYKELLGVKKDGKFTFVRIADLEKQSPFAKAS